MECQKPGRSPLSRAAKPPLRGSPLIGVSGREKPFRRRRRQDTRGFDLSEPLNRVGYTAPEAAGSLLQAGEGVSVGEASQAVSVIACEVARSGRLD
jgi:hypothetical protein